MSLNDDLEYLQAPERTDVQRWGWLAGRFDQFAENQTEDFRRLNEHEKQLKIIDRRCAGRRWQGKVMWAALLASVGSLVERLVR